jgi:MFS family permease
MTVLDTNVAVVLPTITRDLGASFTDVEWVVSTYVLCFAALLLPAGSIADRFGRRKVFLCGIGLFALASLLCGATPSAPALYLARAARLARLRSGAGRHRFGGWQLETRRSADQLAAIDCFF